jgi:hypothetical protein
MSDSEAQLLQMQAKPYTVLIELCLIVPFFGFGLFFIEPPGFTLFKLGWAAVGVCMAGLALYRFFHTHARTRQDLAEGQTVVLRGMLETKRQTANDSSDYFCTISGEEFEISFEQYQTLAVGQTVEIHFAPHSQYVFTLIPAV